MTFLPNDYKLPESSGKYFKFAAGPNRFRILGDSVIGWKGWTLGDEPRPIRVAKQSALPVDQVEPEKIRHFWAMPVWNPAAKRVQVLEITQSTIQKQIKDLVESPEWGDPIGYDLNVTRKGEKLDTEYNVVPSPHSPLPPEASAAWGKSKPTFDLNRLFSNGDPFGEDGSKGGVGTPPLSSAEPSAADQANAEPMSQAQRVALFKMLTDKGIETGAPMLDFLHDTLGVANPARITAGEARRCIEALMNSEVTGATPLKDIPF
jgi:hypothetical protein